MTTIITMAIEKGIKWVAGLAMASGIEPHEELQVKEESRDEENTRKRPHCYQSNPEAGGVVQLATCRRSAVAVAHIL